jgi:Flp pilus assembly protein TadB
MLRHLLLALMLAATAAFVVGVAVERAGDDHPAAVEAAEHHSETAEHDSAAEGAEHSEAAEHDERSELAEGGETHEQSEELRPLGIDVEATPFVVLVAIVSVALALVVWLRPSVGLLVLVAFAMLAFAALDVREIAHQLDEDDTGLALLAALVAALHAAAATTAVLLARRPPGAPAGHAGTMPA